MDECQPNNTRIAGLEPEEALRVDICFIDICLRLWPLHSSLIFAVNHWFGHGDIYHSAMLPMLVFDIVIPHGLLFTYASCKKSKSEIRRNIFVFLLAVVNKHCILKAKGKRFNSTVNLYNAMWALCLIWLGCTVGRVHSSFMLIQKTKYLVMNQDCQLLYFIVFVKLSLFKTNWKNW